MKKTAAATLLGLSFALLLGSCNPNGGNTPSGKPVGNITLTGDNTLEVGKDAKVTPSVTDTDGKAITAQVTYTSDQPNVIAVDNAGNLTVKRLTATDKPVTITATAGDKSATFQITTYGLEMALGTYNWSYRKADEQPGVYVTTRFRPESGKTVVGELTIKSPNESKTRKIEPDNTSDSHDSIFTGGSKFPAGEYTAILNQGKKQYTAKAIINSVDEIISLFTDATTKVTGRNITISGTMPNNAKSVMVFIVKEDDRSIGNYWKSASLPITIKAPDKYTAGKYNVQVALFSTDYTNYNEILPEVIHRSTTFLEKITLPNP